MEEVVPSLKTLNESDLDRYEREQKERHSQWREQHKTKPKSRNEWGGM